MIATSDGRCDPAARASEAAGQFRLQGGAFARMPAARGVISETAEFPNSASQRCCFFRFCIGAKVRLSQLLQALIMKLHFRSNDLEGQLWQQRTADRLRRALGRLHGLVARMKVRLDDINGPAGGVDKRCNVEVLVRGSSPVVVSATARSWQDSVEAVASRLQQRVVLQLHRGTLVEHQPMALVAARARVVARVEGVSSLRRLRLD